MQKIEIAVILILCTVAVWPSLKKLFTWKSVLILALGGFAFWQMVKA